MLRKRVTRLYLSALFALTLGATGCATTSPERPPCTWKLWELKDGQLERTQEGKSLSCAAPEASGKVCLSKEDLENLLTCGK